MVPTSPNQKFQIELKFNKNKKEMNHIEKISVITGVTPKTGWQHQQWYQRNSAEQQAVSQMTACLHQEDTLTGALFIQSFI